MVLGDSAYPLTDWLITPYPGDPEDARGRFNKAHIKTRNTVERAFGVLKKRFYAMSTGLRVKDMDFASKLVVAAMILRNLCIKFGDREDEAEPPDEGHEEGQADAEAAPGRERRRNQLLIFFQRN